MPKYRSKMIRSREWKLILNEGHEPELYKMDGGQVEKGNVAGQAGTSTPRRALENQLNGWWPW